VLEKAASCAHLEEIGVTKGRAEAENVVSFWVLRDGLHDGAINDN